MPIMMFQTPISGIFKLVLVLTTFRRLVACSSRRIRNTLPNAIASLQQDIYKCTIELRGVLLMWQE